MKKIIIVVLCCLVSNLFFSTCDAKIYRKKDSFDGTVLKYSIMGGREVKPLTQVVLSQNVLIFSLIETEWWFFASDEIEVKFNDEDKIYKWPVYSTDSSMKREFDHLWLRTICNIVFTNEMREQIKTANKVSFRLRFTNQPSIVYNVSEKTLDEWKEVINTPE